MSKPILFVDFDGTLCHDRFWRGLPTEQYEKVQEVLFSEDRTYLQKWMKGKRTAEEVNQLLADQLGIPFEEIWDVFVKDAESMSVSQEVLEKIGSLRDLYTTILITVNMDSFSRFTVPALRLNDYFDAISNSYYEGKFKSDNGGEVFVDYLKKYSAPVEESILIDDSPAVCETFGALGGKILQATTEEDIAFHLDGLK
jgi:FMN phosphatase YigB (HAD superfamily)